MTSVPTVEDFDAMSAKMDGLSAKLDMIAMSLGCSLVVKIADIARMEGLSRSQLCGKEAYLLPNFGRSDYPDGVKRWDMETWLKWRRIPIEERKRMYQTHLESERKKAVQSLGL